MEKQRLLSFCRKQELELPQIDVLDLPRGMTVPHQRSIGPSIENRIGDSGFHRDEFPDISGE
ncbi:hypothetical protein NOJ05_29895 [Neorhizobium galegae]|uniref:hypothetical protein n=1 Tax=Neorhizobium galegae TaxID=399 RepID=UPI002104CB06|nr:hypothetical protein [Neorhizobium galegae]MCQ1781416.1 hypothetical protein [Neorhizobium galegae]MCQ1799224.1 hypothetical protein [Neorhizobium galegae]